MNKCMYCGDETEAHWAYYPMTPIIPEMEELLDKVGRSWMYEKDWNEPETIEESKLNTYDQLLNTVGKGILCDKCDKQEAINYEKYYPSQL